MCSPPAQGEPVGTTYGCSRKVFLIPCCAIHTVDVQVGHPTDQGAKGDAQEESMDARRADGPDANEIAKLVGPMWSEAKVCDALGIEAKALVRFGEPLAKELGLSRSDIRDETEWLALMVEHPILIERPIILINDKAVVGRPPESVLGLINSG